jgi:hypothetical protein
VCKYSCPNGDTRQVTLPQWGGCPDQHVFAPSFGSC